MIVVTVKVDPLGIPQVETHAAGRGQRYSPVGCVYAIGGFVEMWDIGGYFRLETGVDYGKSVASIASS